MLARDENTIGQYLRLFADSPKTRRAYQKEISRFLLWLQIERRAGLADTTIDDCIEYQHFLALMHTPAIDDTDSIYHAWVGPKSALSNPDRKPFSGALSEKSRAYAQSTLKSFFEWLVGIQYIDRNPWVSTKKVRQIRNASGGAEIKIEKSFDEDLWVRLSSQGGLLDQICDKPDASGGSPLYGGASGIVFSSLFRAARAAILLAGATGLRREEMCLLKTSDIKEESGGVVLYEATVIGKGMRRRTVYFNERVMACLRAHWMDRGLPPDLLCEDFFVLSPTSFMPTRSAKKKHVGQDGDSLQSGYSPDGLYKLIKSTFRRIANNTLFDLDEAERKKIQSFGVHALRHTFGTRAAAKNMPLDILQSLMGHSDPKTTAIYINPEKKRKVKAVTRFLA